MKHRVYDYGPDNKLKSLTCFEQSFCNNIGNNFNTNKLKSMMKQGKFQPMPETILLTCNEAAPVKSLEWSENNAGTKKKKKGERILKVAEIKKRKFETVIGEWEQAKDKSRAYPCPNDDCGRVFMHNARLLKHLAKGVECMPSKTIHRPSLSTKGLNTTGANLKDVVLDVMKVRNAFQQPSINTDEAEVVEEELTLSKTNTYKLLTNNKFVVKAKTHYKLGYGRSWRVRGAFRYSDRQKEFLNWAFQLGSKNKSSKLSPHIAADLMKLVGTVEGQKRYPNEPYMKASPTGEPKFQRKELVLHYEIKSWFNRTNSKQDTFSG